MNEPAGIAMPSCQRLSWLWVCLVLSCLPAASAWGGEAPAGLQSYCSWMVAAASAWGGEAPAGYAVVVSDAATPMERRAGVLLEEGLGIGEADPRKAAAQPSRGFGGIGGSEGRGTVHGVVRFLGDRAGVPVGGRL